ncbi:MAG: hypothetical protein LBE12_11230 [Planctomycetaceae bacterium]|jgi:hypothetical protein|nr:hypothetical protein [Planctomycetaceae bacterium]
MNENEIEVLSFSNNWNNKLNNKAFTSLRLHNDTKFEVGKLFRIILKGRSLGTAELREKRMIRIDQLNPFITFLDTGYGVDYTTHLIKTMYQNKNINWETQLLDFCLFLYQLEQKEFF